MRTPSAEMGAEDRAGTFRRPGRALAIGGVILAALLAWPTLQAFPTAPPHVPAAEARRHAACAGWDDLAREAMVRLAKSQRDADLRQMGDAVFRLRRARRNCNAGWVGLACLDYRGIVRGASARAETEDAFACGRGQPDPIARPLTAPAASR